MTTTHRHTPKTSRDVGYRGPVSTRENRAAHGNITQIDTCRCGAETTAKTTTKAPYMQGRYVLDVRCDRDHSGNHQYAHASGTRREGWYQCTGCGDVVAAATLRAQQDALQA